MEPLPRYPRYAAYAAGGEIDGLALYPSDTTLKPVAELNPKAKIKIPLVMKEQELKPRMKLVGATIGPEPVVAANSATNAIAALTHRALRKVPTPDKAVTEEFCAWVEKHRDVLFNGAPAHLEPVPFEEWVLNYSAGVQKLRRDALSNIEGGADFAAPAYTRVKAFVKFNEMLSNKTQPGSLAGAEFKPRVISGGTQEYQVGTGPWVTAFQREMVKRWDGTSLFMLTASRSGEDIGRWFHENQHYPHVTEGDYAAFDSSQSRRIRELMIKIHSWFGCPVGVLKAQQHKIKKNGSFKCGITFTVDGTMASGDPETYIDNSIINGLLMIFAYCKKYNLDPSSLVGAGFKAVLAGDDNLTFTTQDLSGLEDIILKIGLQNEMIVRHDRRDIEFCSGLFWPARLPNGELTCVHGPKPGRMLVKLPWIQSNFKTPLIEFRSKLLGMVRGCSMIPVLNEYIHHYLDITGHVLAKPKYEKHKLTNGFAFSYTPCEEALLMLEHRYGWNSAVLEDFLSQLRAVPLGSNLASAVALAMVERDC